MRARNNQNPISQFSCSPYGSKKYSVVFNYTLSVGVTVPTFFPTSMPTVVSNLPPDFGAQSTKLSININGNASLYAIFFVTAVYASYAVMLVRIRETNLGLMKVAPLPFVGTVLRFALLGLNVSSELSFLVKLFVNRLFILFSIVLTVRLLQIVPSLYFQWKLLPLH